MIHIYKLIETMDTGALHLLCSECGRQVRVPFVGRHVVEVEGDVWAEHHYAAEDDTLKLSFNVEV